MLNPRVLEKLIRHLSKDLKITVRLDYSKDAVPKTDSEGVVTLPAWLDERDAGRLLACVVHESGHGEFDLADMEKIGLYTYEPIFPLIMNVLNDVRIDVRRQKQYKGVHGLYREVWAWADREAQSPPLNPAQVLPNIIKGFLADATGLNVVAPFLSSKAKEHPNYQAIIDILNTVPNKDGFLWQETLKVIDLLQLPKQQGQGQGQQGQAQQGQSGQQGQGEGQGCPSKTLSSELQRIDNKRTLNNVNEKLERLAKLKIESGSLEERRECQRIQNNLTKQLPHPSLVGQAVQQIPGRSGLNLDSFDRSPLELHPANLGTMPLTKVNVDEYNQSCVQTALTKFFEATEETLGDPEVKSKLDSNNLHKLLTNPSEMLIGEMEDTGEDTAVVVLIDCSGSMNDRGKDPAKTKLDLAVNTLQTLVKSGKETNAIKVRLGIKVFSDDAVTFKEIVPIQELKVSDISVRAIKGQISMGGTSIQIGLEDCLKALEDERARRKGVIVITDGQVMSSEAAWIKSDWPEDIAISIITIANSFDTNYSDIDLKDLFKHRCNDDITMPIALSESLTEAVEGGN